MNTQSMIAIALAGVALYVLSKPKKPKAAPQLAQSGGYVNFNKPVAYANTNTNKIRFASGIGNTPINYLAQSPNSPFTMFNYYINNEDADPIKEAFPLLNGLQ